MAPAMNVKINGSIATLLQLVTTVAFVAGTWPIKTNIGPLSGTFDANAIDVTFGAGGSSGSSGAVAGFVFSLLAFILFLVGVIFGFKGNQKIAKGGFGIALIFNCLIYIAFVEVETSGIKYQPQWWWGAGCNIGAFINIVLALVFADKALKIAAGAPPTGIEAVA